MCISSYNVLNDHKLPYFLGPNNNLSQACSQNINMVDAAASSVDSHMYVVYLHI